jgi:hypothetical protein
MSTIAEYSTITYLIEIVAISLVAVALIAIIAAIFFRQWSGKAEHKKMLSLRHSMQYEKEKVDITISEIIDIERETHDNLATTKIQMKAVAEQQKAISNSSKEIELRAEHVALLEKEVKQTADILSERIDSIEKRWDEKLEKTVTTVDQLSSILEDNLKHLKNQNIAANNLTQSLTDQYDQLQLEKKQAAIHASIDTTLKASIQLNEKLESLQQKAESAFLSFSKKLDHFDKKIVKKQQNINKTHITFDDIDAIAPSVKEQPFDHFENYNDDKSEPSLIKETATKHLNKPTQLKDYAGKDFFPANKKKVNE